MGSEMCIRDSAQDVQNFVNIWKRLERLHWQFSADRKVWWQLAVEWVDLMKLPVGPEKSQKIDAKWKELLDRSDVVRFEPDFGGELEKPIELWKMKDQPTAVTGATEVLSKKTICEEMLKQIMPDIETAGTPAFTGQFNAFKDDWLKQVEILLEGEDDEKKWIHELTELAEDTAVGSYDKDDAEHKARIDYLIAF